MTSRRPCQVAKLMSKSKSSMQLLMYPSEEDDRMLKIEACKYCYSNAARNTIDAAVSTIMSEHESDTEEQRELDLSKVPYGAVFRRVLIVHVW